MNIRKKIKETVAKIVTEKKGRDVTGPKRKPDGKIDKNNYFKLKNITIKKDTMKNEGEDHEVSMAQSSLDSIIRSATELKTKIGNNEIDIPAWIQDHITNSETYIDQASQGYHEYSNSGENTEMNEYGEGGYYTNDGSDGDYYDDGSDGDYAHDKKVESEAYQLYDKGLELFRQGKEEEAEMLRQQALKKASWLSWGDNELPKYSSNKPQQELDEAMIRRWQHYAGIK